MKKLTRDETEHGQHYYSAAEVDALLAQPQPIGEGFFLPDGTFSGSASKKIGRLRPTHEDAAAGCTIRLLYTTPPQRQPPTT